MEIEIPLHGSRPPVRPPKRGFLCVMVKKQRAAKQRAKAQEQTKQTRKRKRVAEAGTRNDATIASAEAETSRVADQKDSSAAHAV